MWQDQFAVGVGGVTRVSKVLWWTIAGDVNAVWHPLFYLHFQTVDRKIKLTPNDSKAFRKFSNTFNQPPCCITSHSKPWCHTNSSTTRTIEESQTRDTQRNTVLQKGWNACLLQRRQIIGVKRDELQTLDRSVVEWWVEMHLSKQQTLFCRATLTNLSLLAMGFFIQILNP